MRDEAGPESAPSFDRRVVIGPGQAAGLALMMAVPALALAQLLGDRVERREVTQGDWILSAEAPVCARDGCPLQITVTLSTTADRAMVSMPGVDISPDYLARFTDVRRRPSVFKISVEPGPANAASPVVIELTPDRFGWARGRLGVTTETGERLELDLKTFVFP